VTAHPFTEADRAELAARGISIAEAERQLRLLRHPPPPVRLDRPCVPGDGIVRLDPAEHDELLDRYRTAVSAGRVTKFVPASGAASRMFGALEAATADPRLAEPAWVHAASPEEPAGTVLAVARDLGRIAFGAEVLERLRARNVSAEDLVRGCGLPDLLHVMLTDMGLARAPKGLIPFHRYPEGPRTAFEEQLVEAAAYARDGEDIVRAHFTVPDPYRREFVEAARRWAASAGVEAVVAFSTQDASTDTLALDEATDDPFRSREGALVFRPGGHGALIGNLQNTGADLVLVKNIDNVVPDHLKSATLLWKRLLGGYLLRLEEKSDDDRPIRVCGVVRNQGEPGGGPFWVRHPDGTASPQIVERSQIDVADPGQASVWESSSHFNPVDLACALRNRTGHAYELEKFVDPNTVFVAEKTHEGRRLRALERPGLWNGAMARWETRFVEVPVETFAPVKTVLDLLRPQHQPA